MSRLSQLQLKKLELHMHAECICMHFKMQLVSHILPTHHMLLQSGTSLVVGEAHQHCIL